jgi:hypothetical protein
LRLAARVVLLQGTLSCILTDLSTGGARILINQRLRIGDQAVLTWGRGLEAFGEIVWAAETHCGILFEEPLPETVLKSARDLHDSERLPGDLELTRRTAHGFVHGGTRL